jgi:hypothetical protein
VSDFTLPNVSVIDTSSNTVVDTVTVGGIPNAVAITPPVPFSAFSAYLAIAVEGPASCS